MPDIMQSVRLRQPELSSINTFPPPPLVPPIYTEAGTMLPEYYIPTTCCLPAYLLGWKENAKYAVVDETNVWYYEHLVEWRPLPCWHKKENITTLFLEDLQSGLAI